MIVRSRLPTRLRVELPVAFRDPARAAGIQAALRQIPDVAHAHVNPITGRALIDLHRPPDDLDALLACIATTADHAGPLTDHTPIERALTQSETASEAAIERDWLRVAFGASAVGLLALLRLFGGPLALASPPIAALATGAALVVGLPTFVNGLKPLLRFRAPEIDTLITTATFASLLVGEAATGLIVVWLIALGELVEELTLDRTRRAISDLLSVGEEYAWIVVGDDAALLEPQTNGDAAGTLVEQPNGSPAAAEDARAHGREIRVKLDHVEAGAVVVVHAGEKIPVDGVVLRGSGSVNQAPITGESMPVFRNPGDDVFAGTFLIVGSLLVRATRVGADTTIGRIIALVEEAREVQAPIQRMADRFSRRIVPLSFLLAGGVFALTRNVLRSMTILVIACPCAAGLATPTAVSAAIARAARRGILIKGGLHLETAGSVDAVIFDKTGTLTTGAPRVTRVMTVDKRYSPERILAFAASGELHSQHPVAAAVLEHTAALEIEIPAHSEYEIIVGHGVRFAVDGQRLVIGSRHMMDDFGIPVSLAVEDAARLLRQRGQTVLWVAEAPERAVVPAEHFTRTHPDEAEPSRPPAALPAAALDSNSHIIGLIGVSDVIRTEAAQALSALRAAGVRRLQMITGDSRESAAIVAAQLHLDPSHVAAEALPEEKFRLVRRLQSAGYRVALVGDGTNDAPALAAADVGIAMGHGGADVALEAADIALAADDIRDVAEVIHLSRRTMRLVRQNFAFSLGVNGLGVIAGALGVLSPFAAALLHNLSTVAVVLNSGRLLSAPTPLPPSRPSLSEAKEA